MTTTEPTTVRDEYEQGKIDGMRRLLDWLETNPNVQMPYFGTVTFYGETSDIPRFTDPTGTVTKEYSESYLRLVRDFGGGIRFEVCIARESVCVRRVVGTKTVPVRKYIETGETEEQEIVEWECLPVLGLVGRED